MREYASPLAVAVEPDCELLQCRCVWGLRMPHERRWRLRLSLPARSVPGVESLGSPKNGQIRRDEKSGRSRRQTGATLGAARFQYGTTGSGLHPLTKSVFFCTTTLAGLECTFHASLLTSLSRRLEATSFRLGQRAKPHNAPTSSRTPAM